LTRGVYIFVIDAWVLEELHSCNEPRFQYPLPPTILTRELELYEMVTGLVAVHDSLIKGTQLFGINIDDVVENVEDWEAHKRAMPFINLRDKIAKQHANDSWIPELQCWLGRASRSLPDAPPVNPKLYGGMGDKGKKVKKRGAKIKYDKDDDKKIFDAWKTGKHSTYLDLANKRNKDESAKNIRMAVDRHRHRHR
jgi:hypothetical protein